MRTDTACSSVEVQVWIIEERSLKVMEIQEPQEYAQTQVSEERRQRVSQAKKRYNCYKKNIGIVKVRECKNLRNTPQLRFQRRQRVSQAKKWYNCYTEKNNSDSNLY